MTDQHAERVATPNPVWCGHLNVRSDGWESICIVRNGHKGDHWHIPWTRPELVQHNDGTSASSGPTSASGAK